MKKLCWAPTLLVLLLFAAQLARAQEPNEPIVYQPVGAPSDAKVNVRWNRYYSHAEASKILKDLAEAHPDHVRLESLGKSYGDRELWMMTITNFEKGDPAKKPAFWIDGGIHANELQSVEVVLYTAWYLAETYGRYPAITRLLNERTFYLAPMLSPDSRDAHMTQPNTTHSPRTGQRPIDDDRDGLVDEDEPDDLDGDGHITQMRIRDKHGRYKSHPDFPQLMIRADADEQGEFTLLGSEGIDNDDDGRVNEDGDGNYDPNRNWAWNWQPQSVQRGSHYYPFSLPENRAFADFVLEHPNIAGAQSYHNTGGMLLRPPGGKNVSVPNSDIAIFKEIAAKGEEMLPGYRSLSLAEDLYVAYGTEVDWFYGMRGVFCFTNELNTPFNLFRHSEGGGYFASSEQLHKFDKLLLLGEGMVPWHEVEHPQYGKVEVGGLKKNWARQPPSFLLEEECHRNMAFTLYHAQQMPAVEIDAVEVEELAGGLKQVTATIFNPKLIPTHAEYDVRNKITPPDRVLIEGDEVEVLAAFRSDDKLFRDPEEVELRENLLLLKSIPAMRPVYLRWLVRGEGPWRVTVESLKGGTATKNSAVRGQ